MRHHRQADERAGQGAPDLLPGPGPGGPIGKVRDGDLIRIVINRRKLEGSVDLAGTAEGRFGPEEGARVLADRPPRPDLAPDPDLPDDTRLWALLQAMGGGAWGGCVYDLDALKARTGG